VICSKADSIHVEYTICAHALQQQLCVTYCSQFLGGLQYLTVHFLVDFYQLHKRKTCQELRCRPTQTQIINMYNRGIFIVVTGGYQGTTNNHIT